MTDYGVPVDFVDAQGRRYLAVPRFPDSTLRRACEGQDPDACADCGALIRHAFTPYYQRNDASDWTEGNALERVLMALTFEYVCLACGQAAQPQEP